MFVSGSKIVEGQGTPAIKVSYTDDSITATIEITGLPANCPKDASMAFIQCRLPKPAAVKIDEFSFLSSQVYEERLDSLLAELNNDPTVWGYILERFNRGTTRLQIEQKLNNLLTAIKLRKFPAERLIVFIGNSDKSLTELWIVPVGAESPDFEDAVKINLPNYKKDLTKVFMLNGKNVSQKTNKD